MSEEKKTKVRNARSGVGINVTLQIVAMLIIVIVVNILGFNYYMRRDYSRSQKFVLSDQTRQVLKQIKKPLKVIIYFSPTSRTADIALYNDVFNFFKEIQFSLRKNIEIEAVNPAQDFNRAREMQAKYKFGADENVVVLDYDGKSELIPVMNMAQWDQTPVISGDPPRIVAFTGEQELTSALIGLLAPDDRKVYFLQGHGEPDFAAGVDLSFLKDFISRQNIKALPVNLSKAESFPKDAGAIVIIGAKYDPSDTEFSLLDLYWQKNGSFLIYLDPEGNTPKLAAFLEARGIKPMNNRVLRTQRISPTIIVIVSIVNAIFVPDTPPTRRLGELNVTLLGKTQSLDLVRQTAEAAKIGLRPLMIANTEYWGEVNYVSDEKTGVKFDEGVDIKGPVIIAASAEKGGVDDENVALRSARLVVVGSKDCVLDQAINPLNVDFFLSSLNWMLDRGKLSGISPKNVRQFYLLLSDSQVSMLAVYTMFAIPGVVALLGIIAWWRRRK